MALRPSIIAATLVIATGAFAQDDKSLNVEGETLISSAAAPAHMENVDTLYSGWHFRSGETQALQADDFDNPGNKMPVGEIDLDEVHAKLGD